MPLLSFALSRCAWKSADVRRNHSRLRILSGCVGKRRSNLTLVSRNSAAGVELYRQMQFALTKRRHVRQLRGCLERSSPAGHGTVVGLVVTAPSAGRGVSEIRRELRWPVRYDHSHCD